MDLDPRILVGVITFIAVILASIINNYVGFYLARIKTEEDKKLSELQNIRCQREQALKNLYLLSTRLSFSKADMAEGKDDLRWFNDNYDSANELIAELMMSFSLYFQEYKKDFKPLLGEAGYYWKCYKDHLSSEKKDYDSPCSNFQRSLQASLACTQIIDNLMLNLEVTKNT